MKRYLEATIWASDQIEEVVKNGKLDFPKGTFADAVVSWITGISVANNALSNSGPYYYVDEPMARALNTIARHDAQFFDVCAMICATNTLVGVSVPGALRIFAADIVLGELKRPTPRHRERNKNWLAQSFIYSLTREVIDEFGLTLTRNDDGKRKDSACDVISSALSTCGVETKYSYVRDLMTASDKAQLRAEFSAASRIWWRAEKLKGTVSENALNPGSLRVHQELAEMNVRDIQATFSQKQR